MVGSSVSSKADKTKRSPQVRYEHKSAWLAGQSWTPGTSAECVACISLTKTRSVYDLMSEGSYAVAEMADLECGILGRLLRGPHGQG